jgi:ubiquinone/menaquinone biosynthesis C-methylase UbiE
MGMNEATAKKISKQTAQTYDTVATEFSRTRGTFWDELAFLSEYITHDDHVLDIGCGNGRFAPLVAKRHARYVGIDYSKGLISEEKRLHPDITFTVSDATDIPFPENHFDIAYAFAVIHHIPSRALRRKFFEEARRVLHPGGLFIFTSWDIFRPKYFRAILHSAIDAIQGKNELEIGDALLTFGKSKAVRYVHAFTRRELRMLAEEAGLTVISEAIITRKSGERNIVFVTSRSFEEKI